MLLMVSQAQAQADAVIDGNTLEIQGERVRLFGMDAFELAQTCLDARGEPWRCGVEAKAALADLVQDHPVACRVMVDDPDGGYVARCRVQDDIDIGGYMVSSGLALAERHASDDYVDDEAAALADRRPDEIIHCRGAVMGIGEDEIMFRRPRAGMRVAHRIDLIDIRARHTGTVPSVLMRCNSRIWLGGKAAVVAACMVQRLSHISRSPAPAH